MMELLVFIDAQLDEIQFRPGMSQIDVTNLLLDLRSQVVTSIERSKVPA